MKVEHRGHVLLKPVLEQTFLLFYCIPAVSLTVSSVVPDVEFLRSVLPPTTDAAFFQFLRGLDCSGVTLRSIPEGTVVFARVSCGALGSEAEESVGVRRF